MFLPTQDIDPELLSQGISRFGQQVQRTLGFYPNEVRPACRIVEELCGGARTVLLAHPMMSGKTNIMSATTHILRMLDPSVQALYVCANDQLDLRRQSHLALSPHVELLSRSQRKKWERQSDGRPLVVFYDESHFGDGAEMGVAQFLERHGLLHEPRAVFVGVSATAFSSFNCLDATVWADMAELEEAGYNSPQTMLDRGRLRRSEAMFETPSRRVLGRQPTAEDVAIVETNPALTYLEGLLRRPMRSGYCLIRCKSMEAEALRGYLERRWGPSVYVVDWNMHNKVFSPEAFFQQRRLGSIAVVLVQHKARMGNVIATDACHFMFEHAPSAKVDTIAQSFLGRACGFGKRSHTGLIWTNPDIAEAYSELMGREGGQAGFARCLHAYRLKPATRAKVEAAPARFAFSTLEVFPVGPKDSVARVRARCAALKKGYGLVSRGSNAIRTLSRTQRATGMLHPDGRPRESAAAAFCGDAPGDWSIVAFDIMRPSKGERPQATEKKIMLAIRGDSRAPPSLRVGPTEQSLHWDIQMRRQGRASVGSAVTGTQLPLVAAPR